MLDCAFKFNVIIVDQNSDNSLADVISAYDSLLLITHLKVSFVGANRARNEGVRHSDARWVMFPDDDIVFLKDSLNNCFESLSNNQLQLFSGITIDVEGKPNVLRWRKKEGSFSKWDMFSCLSESTIFVQRELFLSVNGFDERFGPGEKYPAAEGIDLVNRMFMLDANLKTFFTPRIQFAHPCKIPPWNDWAVERMASYGFGDGAMLAKNKQLHIIKWGAVTLAAAFITLFSLDKYKRKAFFFRIVNMIRGFFVYSFYDGKQ